jgi:UDP-glucuronate decarboxylase
MFPASGNHWPLGVALCKVPVMMNSKPIVKEPVRRIVVTGGAGFLGSHLCERLLTRGHEVLCVDNFFTGSRRNIEVLLDNKGFELLRHDVTFPLYVEADEIYNLACPASPVHYQFDPVQTTKTSVLGAINILGLAERLKVKILQASTSEVYGDPAVHPQPEESGRHSLMLRRGQAMRGNFVL